MAEYGHDSEGDSGGDYDDDPLHYRERFALKLPSWGDTPKTRGNRFAEARKEKKNHGILGFGKDLLHGNQWHVIAGEHTNEGNLIRLENLISFIGPASANKERWNDTTEFVSYGQNLYLRCMTGSKSSGRFLMPTSQKDVGKLK